LPVVVPGFEHVPRVIPLLQAPGGAEVPWAAALFSWRSGSGGTLEPEAASHLKRLERHYNEGTWVESIRTSPRQRRDDAGGVRLEG